MTGATGKIFMWKSFMCLLCSHLRVKDQAPPQVTDLDVTELGFLGPRLPFCATGALWGCVSESGQGGWKTQGGGKHTVNSA